jgi:hypothetical protein
MTDHTSFATIVYTNDLQTLNKVLSSKGGLHPSLFKQLIKMWVEECDKIIVYNRISFEMFELLKPYYYFTFTIDDCSNIRDKVYPIERLQFFIDNYCFKSFTCSSIKSNIPFSVYRLFLQNNLITEMDWTFIEMCETPEDIELCLKPTKTSRKYMIDSTNEYKLKPVLTKLYDYFKYPASKDYFPTFKNEMRSFTKDFLYGFWKTKLLKEVMFASPFPSKEMKEFRDELFPPEEKGLFSKLFNKDK